MNEPFDAKTFDELKTRAQDLKTKYSTLKEYFKSYDEIYFLTDRDTVSNNEDPADRKTTISPTGRNAVVGMTRLLNTAKPNFKIKAEIGNTDALVNVLDDVVSNSNRALPMSGLLQDATLSAILHGPVTLMVDSIDDLLAVKTLPKYQTARLQDLRRKSAYLWRVIPQGESYPEFGYYGGLSAHLRYYETTVREVRERWGKDALVGSKDNSKVNVWDWMDWEYRAVWTDNSKEPVSMGKHNLTVLPFVCKISGGSNLYTKPEEATHSFLYGVMKSKLHQRESLVLTTLFTSIFQEGAGQLLGIKPDANNGDTITVNYAGGGVRYIIGDVQPLNENMASRKFYEARQLLNELYGQTTIHWQTLGEGVGNNVPFSSMITAAQSGRLPLVEPSEAVGAALAEAASITLKLAKADGVKLSESMATSEIPDDCDITCELTPDLPQDTARNASVAAQLTGQKIASQEWVRSNLLNISDNKEMVRQIWTEQARDALYQQIAQATIPQLLQVLMGTPPAQPSAPTDGMPPEMQIPTEAMPPDGMMPGSAPMPTVPGAPVMPMTEPRMP